MVLCMKDVFMNYLKTNSKELTNYIINKLKNRIKLQSIEHNEGCEFHSEYLLHEEIMDIAGWKMKHEKEEELTYLFYGAFSLKFNEELEVQDNLNGYIRYKNNGYNTEKLFTNNTEISKIVKDIVMKEKEENKN